MAAAVIRGYATELSHFVIDLGGTYVPVDPLVQPAPWACGTGRVVDLGSGCEMLAVFRSHQRTVSPGELRRWLRS